jgi:hypothetical protein
MKRRKLPFNMLPANWGLEGKRRSEAWAHYYLEGEELDRELLDINIEHKDSQEYKVAALALDKKYKKISDQDYEKKHADILNKPYFRVLYGQYKESGPDQGTMTFELDWNEVFIRDLEANGWTGLSNDEIVNAWFEDACKQMFAEDQLETIQPAVTSFNRTRKRSLDGGNSTEYN